jgi:hypothetical protein
MTAPTFLTSKYGPCIHGGFTPTSQIRRNRAGVYTVIVDRGGETIIAKSFEYLEDAKGWQARNA